MIAVSLAIGQGGDGYRGGGTRFGAPHARQLHADALEAPPPHRPLLPLRSLVHG